MALDRERTALGLLDGSHAPKLLAAGSDDAGPFVLEAFALGTSLRQLGEGTSTLQARGAVAARVARALGELHAARDADGDLALIHGDPAPDHFVVAPNGDVLVIDFGASSSRAAPTPSPGRGTLPFVAPELCRGEASASQSTDRYALAVVLAELLVGPKLAARRGEAALLVEIGERGHALDALSPLPTALREALRDALAFSAEDRPSDLARLADPRTYAALDSRAGS